MENCEVVGWFVDSGDSNKDYDIFTNIVQNMGKVIGSNLNRLKGKWEYLVLLDENDEIRCSSLI